MPHCTHLRPPVPASQALKTTFHLNNREFEHNHWVDVTDPAGGFLPGVLQVGTDNSSLELQARLDEEYAQLLTSSQNSARVHLFADTQQHPPLFCRSTYQRVLQNADRPGQAKRPQSECYSQLLHASPSNLRYSPGLGEASSDA